MNKRLVLATIIFCAAINACTQPVVRQFAHEAVPNFTLSLTKRQCALHVDTPVDRRPKDQQKGGSQRHLRTFIYGILFAWWNEDVLDLTSPKPLGADNLPGNLAEAMKATLQRQGPCTIVPSPEDADIILATDILDMYGVTSAYRTQFTGATTYEQSTAGGSNESMQENQLTAAGQVTLRFRLMDQHHTEIDTWLANAGSILQPDGMEEELHAELLQWDAHLLENQRSYQVVKCLSAILYRLPATLDRATADLFPVSRNERDMFRIARLAHDFEHIEIALIETATGRVRAREVIRRPYPLFSPPGQWVLSPFQPMHLSTQQYDELVQQLGRTYSLSLKDNLTAAQFGGYVGRR